MRLRRGGRGEDHLRRDGVVLNISLKSKSGTRRTNRGTRCSSGAISAHETADSISSHPPDPSCRWSLSGKPTKTCQEAPVGRPLRHILIILSFILSSFQMKPRCESRAGARRPVDTEVCPGPIFSSPDLAHLIQQTPNKHLNVSAWRYNSTPSGRTAITSSTWT